jgi:hypothetical protein
MWKNFTTTVEKETGRYRLISWPISMEKNILIRMNNHCEQKKSIQMGHRISAFIENNTLKSFTFVCLEKNRYECRDYYDR